MRVLGIVGSYRKGGVVDTLVDEVLRGAAAGGAAVEKVYLVDQPIEFCRNCRTCMQTAGQIRGRCVIDDGMPALLDQIEGADAVVLGSPMNFGTVTAVTKRFIERLACYGYWPWGAPAPKMRREVNRPGIVVASSAAPALLARLGFGMVRLMKQTLRVLGIRCVGVLFVGLSAGQPTPDLSKRVRAKAQRLGHRLAAAG